MAENKTINPQENIKLLHNYKGDKLASLMQEVSQEKNRALTLKNSIKAKIAQLREIALEKERAQEKAEEVLVPEVAETIEVDTEEDIKKALKEDAQMKKMDQLLDAMLEQEQTKLPTKEVKTQSKKVEKAEKVEKPEKAEKPSQPKKQQPSQPVEIERTATGKPNVWKIKYSDGTEREQYIPPEKPKKTETRVFPGGYDTRAPRAGRPQGQNPQAGANDRKPQNNNGPRPNQQVGQNNVSLQNAAQQFPPKQNQQRQNTFMIIVMVLDKVLWMVL